MKKSTFSTTGDKRIWGGALRGAAKKIKKPGKCGFRRWVEQKNREKPNIGCREGGNQMEGEFILEN